MRSCEFRLLEIHIARNLEYRRHYDARLMQTLLGVFYSVATGTLTDDSRDKTMKNAEDAINLLRSMLAPFGEKHVSVKEEREKENRRMSSLAETAKMMGSLGSFKSLDELRAAIFAMNQSIEQTKQS